MQYTLFNITIFFFPRKEFETLNEKTKLFEKKSIEIKLIFLFS